MRFWDSSALLSLLVGESHSPAAHLLLSEDDAMIVWWASRVECASAVHRLRRERTFGLQAAMQLLTRLSQALDGADVVRPGEELTAVALRLLASHPLRAADALQLAAALVWARGRPAGHELVSLDERLRTAATLEGFIVVPVTA